MAGQPATGGAAEAGQAGSVVSGEAGGAGEAGAGGGTSSGWHLWVLDRTSAHLYGYAPSQLQSTNGEPAEIDITLADLPGALTRTHLEFDAQGDLWIGDLDTYRFKAAELQKTGTAHLAGTLKQIGGNYGRVAFDPAGNLWRSSYAVPALTRFDAATLAGLAVTSTSLVPDFSVTSASDYPLEFDEAGNLYTGFYATQGATTGPNFFGRYDASQQVGSGTTADPPALSVLPRYDAADLARTEAGDFVLANGSATLIRYTKQQMAGSGQNQVFAPEAQITIEAPLIPAVIRVAADPDGNLYVAEGAARVLKLARADVAKAGTFTVAPAMTLRARANDTSAAFQGIAVH